MKKFLPIFILAVCSYSATGQTTFQILDHNGTDVTNGQYDFSGPNSPSDPYFKYEIDFEVIHESMITQLMNYPNPFSTSTRFVFTLTGDQIPDDILIQIMTISGRVVREITESELGAIQIGRNISDFAWDGRDAFGDQLANGVYLYRVKAKIDGVDINLLQSGADKYFHKGLGKMYLLR